MFRDLMIASQSNTPLSKWVPFLTHCILVDYSTVICWTSLFFILGVTGLFSHFYSIFDGKNPVNKHCRP